MHFDLLSTPSTTSDFEDLGKMEPKGQNNSSNNGKLLTVVMASYLVSSIRILRSATDNSNESRKISAFFFVNFWIRMPSHNGLQHSKKKSSKSTRFIFSQRCYDVRNIRKDTIVAQQRTRKLLNTLKNHKHSPEIRNSKFVNKLHHSGTICCIQRRKYVSGK